MSYKLKRRFIFFFVFSSLFIFVLQVKPSFFSFEKNQFSDQRSEYYFSNTFVFNPFVQPNWSINQGFLTSYVPLFSFEGRTLAQKEKPEIQEYIVQEGDTLFSIAEKFNISVETILSANHLEENQKLTPGQKLIILPFTGFIYLVEKNESLDSIAKKYKVKKEDILFINEDLSENLMPGDILFIPGRYLAEKRSQNVLLEGTNLICPIPLPCRRTQGLHFFNAIDFSNGRCGENVFAVLPGIVQKTGFDKIAGNYVRILHDKGIVTFYGHLSKIFVIPGQRVSQGEIIGLTGKTGFATGCHLHFEVRGMANPFK